jgi:hypothetical protein
MFPLWFTLLGGSLVFMDMSPSILFLVFPFFGALVYLWLTGFHHFFVFCYLGLFTTNVFRCTTQWDFPLGETISGWRQNCPNFASPPPPCMKILVHPQRLGLTRLKNMPKLQEDSPVTGNSQKPQRLSLSPPRFRGIVGTCPAKLGGRGTRSTVLFNGDWCLSRQPKTHARTLISRPKHIK